MMAIPVFRTRVAPVLDWCSKILIISEEGIDGAASRELSVKDESRFSLMRTLRREGIDTVICGALSPEMLRYAQNLGLRILHGIAGDIGEVLQAYRKGELDSPRYWLPGCTGARCYKRGAKCAGKTWAAGSESSGPSLEDPVSSPQPGGKTQAGPGGLCVCPQCSAAVNHERAIPCSQMRCPKCSAAMVRKNAGD